MPSGHEPTKHCLFKHFPLYRSTTFFSNDLLSEKAVFNVMLYIANFKWRSLFSKDHGFWQLNYPTKYLFRNWRTSSTNVLMKKPFFIKIGANYHYPPMDHYTRYRVAHKACELFVLYFSKNENKTLHVAWQLQWNWQTILAIGFRYFFVFLKDNIDPQEQADTFVALNKANICAFETTPICNWGLILRNEDEPFPFWGLIHELLSYR